MDKSSTNRIFYRSARAADTRKPVMRSQVALLKKLEDCFIPLNMAVLARACDAAVSFGFCRRTIPMERSAHKLRMDPATFPRLLPASFPLGELLLAVGATSLALLPLTRLGPFRSNFGDAPSFALSSSGISSAELFVTGTAQLARTMDATTIAQVLLPVLSPPVVRCSGHRAFADVLMHALSFVPIPAKTFDLRTARHGMTFAGACIARASLRK
mmetsp:Transcript_843/g.5256  ORF Transcript_843/g.5256 Transcript_843/m.5256 type:complete len:214 (+) Transcript_843:1148-1789(+)